ncbi:MAG: MFS transporter [Acidaminococcaceae bacterium]|nr:MFS transporter [Acidaminococcaceae bacterium]
MAEKNGLLIFILTVGVFGIINTEMGVLGILPLLAEKFSVSIAQAGLLVSLFALAVAIAGPVMPLLFSGIDRKKVILLVLGIFVLGNITAVFTDNFTLMLLARVVPAIFH